MKRRIVIADDDPTIISLVSLRLGLTRFDVLSAANGLDALALIRSSEPVAAILIVRMPGCGLVALDAIKADFSISKLPVMMLTGERDQRNRDERDVRGRQRLHGQGAQSQPPAGAGEPAGEIQRHGVDREARQCWAGLGVVTRLAVARLGQPFLVSLSLVKKS